MNPKVGVWSSPQVETFFCLKNFDTFTRTRILVSKMNVVARGQLAFQMLLKKISIPPEPVFNGMGQQMSGPDSSIS